MLIRASFAAWWQGPRMPPPPLCEESTAFGATLDRTTERVVVTRLGAPLLQARDACTFWPRLRGLHALPPLGCTDALVIRPCNAVQTLRMRYPIDVVYVDDHGVVLDVVTLRPNRLSCRRGAHAVIEMQAGTAARLTLAPGQVLQAVRALASLDLDLAIAAPRRSGDAHQPLVR